MKKRIIYLLMAAIGTVGFTGCGPGHDTTQDRTGTYDSPTGTQMGTETRTTGNTVGTTTGTTGNRTATTTGTSGTRTTTTTGTAGTTTGNTGQRAPEANNDATGAGVSQANQISGVSGNEDMQGRNNFRLNQATDYSYNNENYRFTPDDRGINITRDQNGTQTPYGTMRTFGDDGYFMVTTTNASGEEEISVGRFDERGNFTIYRYDRDGDRVTEQNYRSNTPMNQNNR